MKSNGQPIPWATITTTQQTQTLSTVTDADGHYTFPPLAAGAWNVTVEMFGFSGLTKSVNFRTQWIRRTSRSNRSLRRFCSVCNSAKVPLTAVLPGKQVFVPGRGDCGFAIVEGSIVVKRAYV